MLLASRLLSMALVPISTICQTPASSCCCRYHLKVSPALRPASVNLKDRKVALPVTSIVDCAVYRAGTPLSARVSRNCSLLLTSWAVAALPSASQLLTALFPLSLLKSAHVETVGRV